MTRNCVRTNTKITIISFFTLKASQMTKQHYSLITFIINLSLVSYVIATKNESSHFSPTQDGTSASEDDRVKKETVTESPPTLPLVLIYSEGDHYQPTSFARTITNDGVLCNGTLFETIEESTLKFFCPLEDSDKHAISEIRTDRLYPKTFRDPYEILTCSKEPTPSVEILTHSDNFSNTNREVICGLPEKKGKWFTVGYKFCTPVQPTEVEGSTQSPQNKPEPNDDCSEFKIFEFCYSEDSLEVIFTNHMLRSPRLLRDHRLRHEREKSYEMNTDGYNYFGGLFSGFKEIYDKLEIPTLTVNESPKPNEASSISAFAFTGQKLTPDEDFAFALWRKPTHHYLNVLPMRKDVVQLWNYINDCLRANAIKKDEEYAIQTGGFHLPDLSDIGYIDETISIPNIWLKIVYFFDVGEEEDGSVFSNRTEALAIVLNNNLDDETMAHFNSQYCKINLCQDAFKLKFPEVGNSARCCAVGVDEDIQTFFQIYFKVDGTLHVDFSIST